MSLSEIYAANSYWVNPLIGAIISVALFSITYRRAISARKERAIHAHDEVVKILLRNLLNIDRVLSIQEINRILQTKSREFKVKLEDLPDEISCISDLYTKIAEDEMLTSDNKNDLLEKINTFIEKTKNEVPTIVEVKEEPAQKSEQLTSMSSKSIAFAISAVSAAAGIIVSISLSFFSFTGTTLADQLSMAVTIVLFIGASSAVVAFLAWIIDQSKPNMRSVSEEALNFESRIFRMLKKSGIPFNRQTLIPNVGEFDFILLKNDHSYLIELKLFRAYVPRLTILRLLSRAKTAKSSNERNILVLVANDLKYFGQGISELRQAWDYIFDESEFERFLKTIKSEA